jgi:nucleoside-diphosphate-sugar epimerase
MKVLVTGHHGYIGSVVAPVIAAAGHEVTGVDTSFYGGCDFVDDPRRSRSQHGQRTNGAFMEPRGCNRWEPAARHAVARTAEISQNRCRGLRPVACDAPW